MSRPYKEIKVNNFIIRKFDLSLNESSLKWHRDKNNRKITIISGKNWKIQLENSLPIELKEGKTYKIKSTNWHRLIKGTSSLIVKIEEII